MKKETHIRILAIFCLGCSATLMSFVALGKIPPGGNMMYTIYMLMFAYAMFSGLAKEKQAVGSPLSLDDLLPGSEFKIIALGGGHLILHSLSDDCDVYLKEENENGEAKAIVPSDAKEGSIIVVVLGSDEENFLQLSSQ